MVLNGTQYSYELLFEAPGVIKDNNGRLIIESNEVLRIIWAANFN